MDVRAIQHSIREELLTLKFARDTFPMLTDWGVEDFSVTIHSLGCNYLSALGRDLGFWSMSEYPVKLAAHNCSSIRPDVVWWSRPEKHISLLGEFERFSQGQQQKLLAKARNLLLAHYETGEEARLLLLLSWVMAGTDLNVLREITALGHNGFRADNGKIVPGLSSDSSLIAAAAIFSNNNGRFRLQGVQV
jgi:hypothetical protein